MLLLIKLLVSQVVMEEMDKVIMVVMGITIILLGMEP
jgi:hypothetical protein